MKNQVGKSVTLFLAAVTLFTGCGPPGPRALIRGQKLLEQGEYQLALESLRQAVVLLGNTNAQAFNYLGLAWHHAGHPAQAERAYQRALQLDPDLAEARYNLGCLWLEQDKPDQAKAQLTAYALRRSNSADAWCELGLAELQLAQAERARQRAPELVNAERSFAQALRLNQRDVEALNGLGIVKLRRGNPVEAVRWFAKALEISPDYAPAILNLAIVNQEYLHQPAKALLYYRRYLALKPAPDDAAAVQALVRQLEGGHSPSPVASTASAPVHIVPSTTLLGPVQSQPSRAAGSGSPAAVNSQRIDPAKVTWATRPARPSTQVEPARPAPAKLEVVTVPGEPELKPAVDAVTPPASAHRLSDKPAPAVSFPGHDVVQSRPARRSFLQRLNPANIFHSSTPRPRRAPPSVKLEPSAGAAGPVSSASQSPLALARYQYRALAKPAPGNRAAAERAFAQGVHAQQAQHLAEAIEAYRRAGELDPSFFDVQYNLGLAATQAGDYPLALASYERSLVLQPTSLAARYNFALVLKQAKYWQDAVNELETLLSYHPNDSRAHLALGNLLAQQLHEPEKARAQYRKVLEIDPRNPEAPAIRSWLTANGS